jgi:DNA-binding NarL/FixJ family response regulator
MRILLADDHPVVRHGLRQILTDAIPEADLGEACDARETIQLYSEARWDTVVLDLSMPGSSGLELLKDLRQLDSRTPIIVLSLYPESQYAVRALRAGAAGYLTKECAPSDLIAAIRRAASGGKYISSSIAERLLRGSEPSSDGNPHEKLSDREYEVLTLIASGKTVKEVAEQLLLSVKTVSTYRTRVLEKMQMKTNAELTYYAVKSGLV